MEFLPDSLFMDPIFYNCDEMPKKPWIAFSLALILILSVGLSYAK
jgi:hypothetical protein